MLNKLLKYDLRPIYRHLIIFYIIMLTCAITGRILRCFGNDNLVVVFFREFFNGASLGLCFGALINNVTHIWSYFKQNFYGDPAYLTHTLPINRQTLYLSKFLTTIITILTTIIVIACVLFIDYSLPETFEFISQLIQNTGSVPEFIKFVILIIGVLALEIIFIAEIGLTGIILGHRSINHQALKSFLFAFAIFLISNLISVIVIEFWGQLDSSIGDFVNHSFSTNAAMSKLLSGAIVLYIIYIASLFTFNTKSLQKGINVE